MSVWTFVKIIAAICVLAAMGFTGMLAYHVGVRPLGGLFGGVFERIIPKNADIPGKQPDAEFAKMLDSAELPDIDPGEKSFQKAHELLALGQLEEAREKLANIIATFPTSSSAPVARRILGEINMDEVLSTSLMEGKQTHVVKRGNSFFSIVAQYRTSLDMILHLNGMMEMKSLQPGDEMIVMPLEFKLLIEPQRQALSLWNGDRFLREYPIVRLNVQSRLTPGKTTISSKVAELDGRKVTAQAKEYRAADKVILLAKPALQIRGGSGDENGPRGIILSPEDMEELNLVTRAGNDVEIR